MTIEDRELTGSDGDIREQAAQHTLAAHPLVGVRSSDILDYARGLISQMMRNPFVAGKHYVRFLG
jgi:hypothetical protein